MRRFIEGADRDQSTLLPECLDDCVDESNPVRVLDAPEPAGARLELWTPALLYERMRFNTRLVNTR